MQKFEVSKYKPQGDQPEAIRFLSEGIEKGERFQTLLGVTGSGKTFTMAKVIEAVQKPTLVIAHNKTLAAQLAQEFKTFFPKNSVGYFVSYYDYYQPEAYIASSDTYIEKETQINEEIDRLRHSATASLLTRRDAIVVASVSCIYGLGAPSYYKSQAREVMVGEPLDRAQLIKQLIALQYLRSDVLERGRFRVMGENFELIPPDREVSVRISVEEGIVQSIYEYDHLTKERLGKLDKYLIFPAKHFVVPESTIRDVLGDIQKEAVTREKYFKKNEMHIEAQRISQRTRQDIEMMRELGYCNGIENYSRYLTGRKEGEAPYTLLDYFPKDALVVIDESHVTVPQIRAMYAGDRSRKQNLIAHGFRLPSAADNRPLKFDEFEDKGFQTVYVSATPGEYEFLQSRKQVVEQVIRPTGLLDPLIVVKPAENQVKDLLEEIKEVIDRKERVLVTALTQKMAEDLSEYLEEHRVKAKYLHAKVETLDRIQILEELRRGKFDVLVGVNLLREGLDLPEVSLVAILDADKEGFLRSETSLIQTIGRAARNVKGRVILYADNMTRSMKSAIEETNRRRKKQEAYNKKHGITPKSIQKNIESIVDHEIKPEVTKNDFIQIEKEKDVKSYIKIKEKEMKLASKNLEFEKAALIRDEIASLKKLENLMK